MHHSLWLFMEFGNIFVSVRWSNRCDGAGKLIGDYPGNVGVGMDKPEADRLWGLYLRAKSEFECIAHSGTIMSDDYEATKERAKSALKDFEIFKARRSSS